MGFSDRSAGCEVAVDQNVREVVKGDAPWSGPFCPCATSSWLPSPSIEVVVDVVVCDRDIARAIVDAVVAEMVELIVREQRVVAHYMDAPDARSGCATRSSKCRSYWARRSCRRQRFPIHKSRRAPDTQCSLVHPSVLSAVLICRFSRMMSVVGSEAPWSVTVTSHAYDVVVRANKLCTLMPLNTHLLVERMYRVENTGVWPGAASTVTKLGLTTCCA